MKKDGTTMKVGGFGFVIFVMAGRGGEGGGFRVCAIGERMSMSVCCKGPRTSIGMLLHQDSYSAHNQSQTHPQPQTPTLKTSQTSTHQVNLALKALPTFKCLPTPIGQHNTTTHLLPDESEVIDVISQGFKDVQAGRLPEFPTSE